MLVVFCGFRSVLLFCLNASVWCLAVFAVTVGFPAAADDLSVSAPHRYESAPNATGFFIDLDGTVLTARHAVEGCGSLFTLKDGRVTRAELIAMSDEADLALVRSPIKPYLAAVFAANDQLPESQPIFSAGYDELRHMKDRKSLMYNGFAFSRQAGPNAVEVALFSTADHGASGSPVIDGNGLIIGLIAKREAAVGASGRTEVIAVSAAAIKAFLHRAGVGFRESNQSQVGPLQARAPRASTLTLGVICG
jgi:hypothetical protein